MTKPTTLAVPITAHDQEVTEITLRRPTTKEVRAIKALPYKIDKDEAVTLDMDVAAKYIAVCASIPASSVDQLDISDFNTLCWEIAGFFMSAESSKSTA
ncbi:phage tail assembly protein [Pseudomonas syringae group sp. J309-1]|uniref:phage tail assembly protein n=1 Tax=Pseudomonas syringae group sp. J309-1 TaxID=3079588 RepID=UPI002913CDC8|nr:phage tail assembly protein [Pseudomonas syringae group sp. J309-1]MDU8357979.1 phage tail assembly protein [Pseudomonas syringae group sp. J309-1]